MAILEGEEDVQKFYEYLKKEYPNLFFEKEEKIVFNYEELSIE